MSDTSVFRDYQYPSDSSASQRDEFRGLVESAVGFQAGAAKNCDAILRVESALEHLSTGIRVRHEPARLYLPHNPYAEENALDAASIARFLVAIKSALIEFGKHTRSPVHGNIVPAAILSRVEDDRLVLADYGIAQAYARAFRPDILSDLAISPGGGSADQPSAIWAELGRHVHDRFDRYVPYIAHEKLATHAWNVFEPAHDLYAAGVLAFLSCEASHPYLDKAESEHLLAEAAEMIPFHTVPLTLIRKLDVATPLGKTLRGIIEKLVDSNPANRNEGQGQIDVLPALLDPAAGKPPSSTSAAMPSVEPAVSASETERNRQREIAVANIRAAVRALPQRQLAKIVPADVLESTVTFAKSASTGFAPEIADVSVRFLNNWNAVPEIRLPILVVEIVAADELPRELFDAIADAVRTLQQARLDALIEQFPAHLGAMQIALQESLPQHTAHLRIESPSAKFATTQQVQWDARAAKWNWSEESRCSAAFLSSVQTFAESEVRQQCAAVAAKNQDSVKPENIEIRLTPGKKPPATLAALQKNISLQGTLRLINTDAASATWAPIFRCVVRTDRKVECTPAIDRLLQRAETALAAPTIAAAAKPAHKKVPPRVALIGAGIVGVAVVVAVLLLRPSPKPTDPVISTPIVDAENQNTTPENLRNENAALVVVDNGRNASDETISVTPIVDEWDPHNVFAATPFAANATQVEGGWNINPAVGTLALDRNAAVAQLRARRTQVGQQAQESTRLLVEYLLGRLQGDDMDSELGNAQRLLDWLYERRANPSENWSDIVNGLWPDEITVDAQRYRAFFPNGIDNSPLYVQTRADDDATSPADVAAILALETGNASRPLVLSIPTVAQWLRIAALLNENSADANVAAAAKAEFLWGSREWCRREESGNERFVAFGGVSLPLEGGMTIDVPAADVPLDRWSTHALVYQPLREDDTHLRRVLEIPNY